MQAQYLAKSPYNLVRVILGPRQADDSPADNVYTRASAFLNEWIATGILARENEAAVFPYFQEFTVPDTGERLVRKGFIALGAVEDYSAKIVHRHEQTLSGPKKDRLELLRHTHAHFGQLFMLYPDPAGAIDALLDQAAATPPLAEVTDEYGVIHRVWKIAGASAIQELMADKKLVIADGHHRYETALAFRDENPGLAGAGPGDDDLHQHVFSRSADSGHASPGERSSRWRLRRPGSGRFSGGRDRPRSIAWKAACGPIGRPHSNT